MTNNKTSLEELRQEIDDIDKKIFNLLTQRLGCVHQVGAIKNLENPNTSIIRPGREAAMVRDLHNRAIKSGYNEKVALACSIIWRNIISLSINYEEETRISIHSENPKIDMLTREYFGMFSDSVKRKSDDEVFKDIAKNESSIGVINFKHNKNQKPWWLKIQKYEGEISAFAALPFFTESLNKDNVLNSNPEAIMIAKVKAEPSGKDKFLYAIEGEIPDEYKGHFKILSKYKNFNLCSCDELFSSFKVNYYPKYIGCFAVF